MNRHVLSFSSRRRFVAFAIAAVMLPAAVLWIMQYRSLVDLQGKTKVAVQEDLRQKLRTVAHKVEESLKSLARESLGSVKGKDLENPDKIELQLSNVRQSHPEVDRLFVISNCSCKPKNFALICTPDGFRRIDHSEFDRDPDVRNVLESYKGANLLRSGTESARDFLFWQDLCLPSQVTAGYQFQSYVFYPLFDSETGDPFGFSALTLRPDYIQDKFLPQVLSAMLERETLDSDSAVAVRDQNNRELYASSPGLKRYEVRMPFAPMFPNWELAAGYKGTTIDALARDSFQKSLTLTIFVLLLLVVGMILTLRATAREMRLAEAKSTFVSNVSHELKTPLALIRLFAETLELGRASSPEKAQEYYRIINNESCRLTQLINNVLDFSQIEAGRKQYKFAQCDVGEVVEEVIKSYEHQINDSGFEMTRNIQRGLPPALIDRDGISQALLNLVNNAIKYSSDVKQISVRVQSRDDRIAIEVADSGIGIPRSEHEKIFEKFYRVSTGLVHETKGSGLGLALVKHIVEAHRGHVRVDSSEGKGSRFTILLPATPAVAAGTEMNVAAGGYKIAQSTNS